MTERPSRNVYSFGPFELEVQPGTPWGLKRNGIDLRRMPGYSQKSYRMKSKDALVLQQLAIRALVRPEPEWVSTEDLLNIVWKGTYVGRGSVQTSIYKIRKRLDHLPDDTPAPPEEGKSYVEELEGAYRLAVPAIKGANLSWGLESNDPPRAIKGGDPASPPFVGPGPFPESATNLFFGRTREVVDVSALLERYQTVLLYSLSGAGKSSLINTRLREHLLLRNQVLPVVRMRSAQPQAELEGNPFTRAAIASLSEGQSSDVSSSGLGVTTWSGYIGGLLPAQEEQYRVLIIDQAEEIVTGPGSLEQKRAFFSELGDALRADPSLRLLLSFRQEYLAALERLLASLWAAPTDIEEESRQHYGRYFMGMLRLADADAAIRLPAKSQHVTFDNGLVDMLVQELSRERYIDISNGERRNGPGEFVEPLQLQLVCEELWRSLEPGQTNISFADFRKVAFAGSYDPEAPLGDAGSVMAFVQTVSDHFCERVVAAASERATEDDEPFPELLIDLALTQFITPDGLRTRVPRGEDWTGDLPVTVADDLAENRMLRAEYNAGVIWYELAHDALIEPLRHRSNRVSPDSLWRLYEKAIRQVAQREEAVEQGLTEDFIHQECCLALVGEDGVAQSISQSLLESGGSRLPRWLIYVLEDSGVVRRIHKAVGNEKEVVFELVHPKMAQAIHEKRFRAIERLYRTRKLLHQCIEACRSDFGASMTGCFPIYDAVLEDVDEVMGSANLSESEASLVLRASLTTGSRLRVFFQQLGRTYPKSADSILRDALDRTRAVNVRRNGAAALALLAENDRDERLLALALEEEEGVRRIAAAGLSYADAVPLWERLFDKCKSGGTGVRAVQVLAWIFESLSVDDLLERFHSLRNALPWRARLRLDLTVAKVKLNDSKLEVLVCWAIAAIPTLMLVVPSRAGLATFDMTTLQFAKAGFFEGAFHGVIGSLVWAASIGGAYLIWWYASDSGRDKRPRFDWLVSGLVGGSAGLLAGVFNSLALILVYGRSSLHTMHWITRQDVTFLQLIGDPFLKTGYGYSMPLFGTLVGLGVGVLAARTRRTEGRAEDITSFAGLRMSFHQSFRTAVFRGWPIVAVLMSAVAPFYKALQLMPQQPPPALPKIIGEAINISLGGVGLLAGLIFGPRLVSFIQRSQLSNKTASYK